MHQERHIKTVGQIFNGQRIDLPDCAGLYAFWWLGEKKLLLNSNRHMVLKGPGGKRVDVEYKDWWPANLDYPCLYVGKTTRIKNRFSLHIMRGTRSRTCQVAADNLKPKPKTTSCQLRFGIEHIFPELQEPLPFIYSNVGFSFRTDFDDNAIAERFFEEDRLIGTWRPWFNIDSER